MNKQRFESLVNQHKDSVYRQMVRVCNHREDAEDALGTALLLAYQAAEQLESESAFRAWIGTIGKRVCTKMRSHPAIQRTLEYAEEKGLVAEDSEDMDMAVLKGCVADAVSSLSVIYRDIYIRCELNEESVVEAAKALGISHAAAKSRLLRAREIVRRQLDHSICSP